MVKKTRKQRFAVLYHEGNHKARRTFRRCEDAYAYARLMSNVSNKLAAVLSKIDLIDLDDA